MAGRYLACSLIVVSLAYSCSSQKPAEPKKAEPPAIVKPKHDALTEERRAALGFPTDLITKLELAAGSKAEPFFVSEVVPSENLKGEKGVERERLAGFSVRTKTAEDLITAYRSGLRVKGFLIFRSHRSYGTLPDIITVVKGNNSYDILKMQGTEAPSYRLNTKKIIAWLKTQQQQGSFVITGAGPDWLEARFIKPPQNMKAFARKVYAFAPDVRAHGPQTVDKLAAQMKKTNGFYLVWD